MKPVAKYKNLPTLAVFLGCLSCIYQKQLMTMLPFNCYGYPATKPVYHQRNTPVFHLFIRSVFSVFKSTQLIADISAYITVYSRKITEPPTLTIRG